MKKRTKKPSDHKSELTRLKSGKLPYAKLDPTFKIRSEERERYRLSVGVFRNSESKRQFFKQLQLKSREEALDNFVQEPGLKKTIRAAKLNRQLQQHEFKIIKASPEKAEVHIFYFNLKPIPFLKLKNKLLQTYPIVPNHPITYEKHKDACMKEATYIRKIRGTGSAVFIKVLSLLSFSDRESFATTWELKKTESQGIIAKDPSKDNIQYGIFNQSTENEILASIFRKKKDENGNLHEPKDVSKTTGIETSTIYKHLSNQLKITRFQAMVYAKYFGMDPSEILFNDLEVPIQGTVNFTDPKSITPDSDSNSENERILRERSLNDGIPPKAIYDVGEIVPSFSKQQEFVICPRDLYRPDIQATKIESSGYSSFKNHVVFWYSGGLKPKKNDICVFLKKNVPTLYGRPIDRTTLESLAESSEAAKNFIEVMDTDIENYDDAAIRLAKENPQNIFLRDVYYMGVYQPINNRYINILQFDNLSNPWPEGYRIESVPPIFHDHYNKDAKQFSKNVENKNENVDKTKKAIQEALSMASTKNIKGELVPEKIKYQNIIEIKKNYDDLLLRLEAAKYVRKNFLADEIYPIVGIINTSKIQKEKELRSDLIKEDSYFSGRTLSRNAVDKAKHAEYLSNLNKQNKLQGKMLENYEQMEKNYEDKIIPSYEKLVKTLNEKDSIYQEMIKKYEDLVKSLEDDKREKQLFPQYPESKKPFNETINDPTSRFDETPKRGEVSEDIPTFLQKDKRK